jgi:hypothetical protein
VEEKVKGRRRKRTEDKHRVLALLHTLVHLRDHFLRVIEDSNTARLFTPHIKRQIERDAALSKLLKPVDEIGSQEETSRRVLKEVADGGDGRFSEFAGEGREGREGGDLIEVAGEGHCAVVDRSLRKERLSTVKGWRREMRKKGRRTQGTIARRWISGWARAAAQTLRVTKVSTVSHGYPKRAGTHVSTSFNDAFHPPFVPSTSLSSCSALSRRKISLSGRRISQGK